MRRVDSVRLSGRITRGYRSEDTLGSAGHVVRYVRGYVMRRMIRCKMMSVDNIISLGRTVSLLHVFAL